MFALLPKTLMLLPNLGLKKMTTDIYNRHIHYRSIILSVASTNVGVLVSPAFSPKAKIFRLFCITLDDNAFQKDPEISESMSFQGTPIWNQLLPP